MTTIVQVSGKDYADDLLSLCARCRPKHWFFSSRRRHTSYWRDWSSGVCSSDLEHETLPARDPDDGRVVAVVQADDQLGGGIRRAGRGQAGHHGLELAGRDLAGAAAPVGVLGRADESRVGKECRSRWSPYRSKKT